MALVGLLLGCQKLGERADAALLTNAPSPPPAASAASVSERDAGSDASSAELAPDASVDAAPSHEPGTADRDETNDEVVAPPEPIADCEARLESLGVAFTRAELPLRTTPGGIVCGTPQAVVYKGRVGGARWSSPPLVTCGLALALAHFEVLANAEALREFGASIRTIEQGGTYNCRKMARFSSMVSEHSYGNAIDLKSFRLSDGRLISVLAHFGRPSREPSTREGKFLRALARRAYDEQVFSVVLTEFFDALHRDHFHVDMARYRIDGTR